jgi:hypothetical protein
MPEKACRRPLIRPSTSVSSKEPATNQRASRHFLLPFPPWAVGERLVATINRDLGSATTPGHAQASDGASWPGRELSHAEPGYVKPELGRRKSHNTDRRYDVQRLFRPTRTSPGQICSIHLVDALLLDQFLLEATHAYPRREESHRQTRRDSLASSARGRSRGGARGISPDRGRSAIAVQIGGAAGSWCVASVYGQVRGIVRGHERLVAPSSYLTSGEAWARAKMAVGLELPPTRRRADPDR